jgi:hypothetical protein
MVLAFQHLKSTLLDKDSAPAAGFNAFCDLRTASNAPGMAGLTRWEQLPLGFSKRECLFELCNRREVDLTMAHLVVLKPQDRRLILRKLGRRLLKRRHVTLMAVMVGEISPAETRLATELIEECRKYSVSLANGKVPSSSSGRRTEGRATIIEFEGPFEPFQEEEDEQVQVIREIIGELEDHVMPDENQTLRSPKRMPGALSRALRIRDSDGRTALHWIHDPAVAQLLFSALPHGAVVEALMAEDQKGQRPLETLMLLEPDNIRKHNEMLELAEEYDPYVVERLSSNATSLYMLLDKDAQNAPGRSPVVAWTDLATDLEQVTTPQGMASLRKPLEDCGPSGRRLWDHIFNCVIDAPGGFKHSSQGTERLLHVWASIEKLINVAALGQTTPGITVEMQLLLVEELLEQTKGPCAPDFDPRESYREALLNIMKQSYTNSLEQMSEACEALPLSVKQDVGGWFTQDVPCDEIHLLEYGGMEWRACLPRELRKLPLTASLFTYDGILLRKRLRHDISPFQMNVEIRWNPEWTLTRDVAGAYEELESLNLIHCMHDLVQIANPDGPHFLSEETCFARLHAAWLRATYLPRLHDIRRCLEEVLGTPILPLAKSWPKSFEDLWHEAEAMQLDVSTELENLQSEQDWMDPLLDPLVEKVKKQLRTPANWVCSLASAELILENIDELRKVYTILEDLVWERDHALLLRTKNEFHGNAVQGDQVRCIACYVAVMVGNEARPFIVELQLHLRKFREIGLMFRLASRCLKGGFDHSSMADFWEKNHPNQQHKDDEE